MAYITIPTQGNATDFGDLTVARQEGGGFSNSVRGGVGGGGVPSPSDVIDYVTIMSTGNAIDFGDLTSSRAYVGGCADGHGGLG